MRCSPANPIWHPVGVGQAGEIQAEHRRIYVLVITEELYTPYDQKQRKVSGNTSAAAGNITAAAAVPRGLVVFHLLILVLLMGLLVPLLLLREYYKRYRQCLKRIQSMVYQLADASLPW